MHALMELYPICRSLNRDGVRETFATLEREVPLELTAIPERHAGLRLDAPP